ncbi:MAG: sigma-70 family RNA polymerase sigma factor [Actinomycetota bacterium]|nr:sigma-70 family RNA polymerase sigma factor [Actinomycetota bacterium]
MSDNNLAAAAAGDFDAFAELYERHLCSVYRLVRSKVGDDDVAEDITAHVFFKALDKAGTFRGEGPYEAWLFRIASNAVATWKHQKGKAPVTLEVVPDALDPSPSAATHVLASEARDFVWAKVADLPPDQKRVVELRYLRELSIEEVGHRMRRSRGAVRVLLHRARLRLRSSMEGKDPR